MFHPSNSLSSFPLKRQGPSLLLVVMIAVVFHVVLLTLAAFWEPIHPEPKKKAKLIVQTVSLKPFQSATVLLSAPSPISPPSIQTTIPIQKESIAPLIPEPVKEAAPVQHEVLIPKEEISPIKEEIAPVQEIASVTQTAVVNQLAEQPSASAPSIPLKPSPPTKAETKPLSKIPTPKPVVKEPPKNIQPAAPIKKPIEPIATTPKIDPKKQKQAEEAEKQRNLEQKEKKRQQEQAEAEKKRQKEIAEAEKKRKQEIAAVQEAARQKEQAALAKAKENLAKMNQTRDKMSASPSVNLDTTTLPKELASLHVDALSLRGDGGASDWGIKESSYSDEVAYRLKMNLKLPDYGAVTIKLTLERTGKVKKVEILKSESNKNKTYVESKIPTIVFSPFGQKFQGVSENTFVITLKNNS